MRVVVTIYSKVVCEDSEECSAEEIVSLQLSVISYILIFYIFLLTDVKIREVCIRTIIISCLQEKDQENWINNKLSR